MNQSELRVVVVSGNVRPGDEKTSKLMFQLKTRFDRVSVCTSDEVGEEVQAMGEGWVMLLQDDSLVNVDRLADTFNSFHKIFDTHSVLMPYKVDDDCNLGRTLSKGEFYKMKDVHSFRGMILHSKVASTVYELNKRLRMDEEWQVGKAGSPKGSKTQLVSFSPDDPLGASKDRLALTLFSHVRGEGEKVTSETTGVNLVSPLGSNVPTDCQSKVFALRDVAFYTVYPNLVQYDATHATRRSDMFRLNECKISPSSLGQYITTVATNNIYIILMCLLMAFSFAALIYWKHERKKKIVGHRMSTDQAVRW